MEECMLRYPNVFEEETVNFDLFTLVYGQIWTRCFDTTLVKTALVPCADMYNHCHYGSDFRCIVKRLQLSACPESAYFGKSKFMNDYSQLFEQELQ